MDGEKVAITCPIGLYSYQNSQIVVRCNPADERDETYHPNPIERDLYTRTTYLTPEIIGRTGPTQTYTLQQLPQLLQEWDPTIQILKINSTTVTVKFSSGSPEVVNLVELLTGKHPKSTFRFKHVKIKAFTVTLSIPGQPWDLGLQDPTVIYAVAYLITTRLDATARNQVVKVARFCSEYLSFTPESATQGLLMGKWTESGEVLASGPGTRDPTSWNSSREIIDALQACNGGKIPAKPIDRLPNPVKYGQCFIFGCLMTTFLRILGIPCRTVRTEDAAHDSVRSSVIAVKEGEKVPMWNFHVWNELWCRRDDLQGTKYAKAGWQVIDGTPQGVSYDAGAPQTATGPTPLAAVRDLAVDVAYDTAFVISEVNAVIATYLLRSAAETGGRKRDNWYLYDVGKWMCGTRIRRESATGPSMLWHKTLVPLLTNVRDEYVNLQVDPRHGIAGHPGFTPYISLGASTSERLHLTIRGVPSPYLVFVIVSLDYHEGPLESEEITAANAQVRELTPGINTFEWNFNGLRLIPYCERRGRCSRATNGKHSKSCPTFLTVRIGLRRAKATTLADSGAILYVYQWWNGQWVAHPGLNSELDVIS
jgi:hypothetical protein